MTDTYFDALTVLKLRLLGAVCLPLLLLGLCGLVHLLGLLAGFCKEKLYAGERAVDEGGRGLVRRLGAAVQPAAAAPRLAVPAPEAPLSRAG